MDKKVRFYKWVRRYVSLTLVIVVGIVVFVLFFNGNSAMQIYEHQKEIVRLKAEIKDNTDTLEHYRMLNSRLETDVETMERIVREQHHMQRPSEDVYLFD